MNRVRVCRAYLRMPCRTDQMVVSVYGFVCTHIRVRAPCVWAWCARWWRSFQRGSGIINVSRDCKHGGGSSFMHHAHRSRIFPFIAKFNEKRFLRMLLVQEHASSRARPLFRVTPSEQFRILHARPLFTAIALQVFILGARNHSHNT